MFLKLRNGRIAAHVRGLVETPAGIWFRVLTVLGEFDAPRWGIEGEVNVESLPTLEFDRGVAIADVVA